jgi:hypothetical protein
MRGVRFQSSLRGAAAHFAVTVIGARGCRNSALPEPGKALGAIAISKGTMPSSEGDSTRRRCTSGSPALGAAERREQRGHLADHLADGFAHAAHFGLALFVAGRIDAVFVAQALEADQQPRCSKGMFTVTEPSSPHTAT